MHTAPWLQVLYLTCPFLDKIGITTALKHSSGPCYNCSRVSTHNSGSANMRHFACLQIPTKFFVFRPKGLKNSQYCKFKFGVQGFHNFSAIRKHLNKSQNWPSSQIKSRLHCIEIFDDDCNFSVLCFSDIDIYV